MERVSHANGTSSIKASAIPGPPYVWCHAAIVDAALAGLVGAGIGAVGGFGGSLATSVLAGRRQREAWRLDQMASAYGKTLEHLTRAAVPGGEFTANGAFVLTKDDVRELMLSLADAEHSLTLATGFCSPIAMQTMTGALADLSALVRNVLPGPNNAQYMDSTQDINEQLWRIQETVSNCAQNDLGRGWTGSLG